MSTETQSSNPRGKAVVLFSGGLDSMLAVCVLKEQNIDVIGLNVVTDFHNCSETAQKMANLLKIELVVQHTPENYLSVIAHPKWGYGKAINPCIDCRIVMCRMAKQLMEERGADFVATGEISGQRPNSQQMHQLTLITRESQLNGRLLRPLSAKVLPPTEVELSGLIDRSKLLSYTGRGRTSLIDKARDRYHIKEIPQPSTGCLLCEKSFSRRVIDLFKHNQNPTSWDAGTLCCGRIVRIDRQTRCIISRNAADGDKLEQQFAKPERASSFQMIPDTFQGPSLMLIREPLFNGPKWSFPSKNDLLTAPQNEDSVSKNNCPTDNLEETVDLKTANLPKTTNLFEHEKMPDSIPNFESAVSENTLLSADMISRNVFSGNLTPENMSSENTTSGNISPENRSSTNMLSSLPTISEQELVGENLRDYITVAGQILLRFSNPDKFDPENAFVFLTFSDEKTERVQIFPDISAESLPIIV